jgi:anti-sigma regulatory factor (Ser/Thr protein kinase)
MGQLRAALRAYAIQDQAPSDVLTSADELVRGLAEDVLVTCVYAVLDPRDGALTVANAGHVPPLLLGSPALSRGSPCELDATGPPLGAGGDEPYGELHLRLVPGQLLALYTDGLVERRDRDIDAGVHALGRTLDPLAPHLDAVCADVTSTADSDDDAALLLVRLDAAGAPPEVSWTFEAEPRAVGAARTAACGQLDAWGEHPALAEVAELAVSELVTNAIRHGTGPLTLRLSRHDDGVVVEVTDGGAGTPRRRRATLDDEGGRGLQLVGALAAGWGVRPAGAGKIVWCRIARRSS